MSVTGKTGIVSIFGWPVEHSLSPEMHNAAFNALGIDMCYVALPVHPNNLRDAVAGLRAMNMIGANITVPHKEAVMTLMDEVHSEAAFIGAVNTIVNAHGKLVGYNTDGRGFMQSLDEAGIDVSGKRILVVGTGGAARAVSAYLCEEAGEVNLYGRNKETGARLLADLEINHKNARLLDSLDALPDMDIVINSTPLGLKPSDPLPFDVSRMRTGQVAVDLIYRQTQLLREASARGCRTLDGLGMLLWQGVLAFELWTGQTPPHKLMMDTLRAGFARNNP